MKSMKLYDNVRRIHNELAALGISPDAALRVDQLTPFDQYHYFGTSPDRGFWILGRALAGRRAISPRRQAPM
jgi:hypothetical protein